MTYRPVARITDEPLALGVTWLDGIDYDTDDTLDNGVILYVASSIEDRLGDVYDAAGAYLTACDQIDNADTGRSSLEAIVRRDAAFAELRAARYPDEAS